MTNPDPEFLKRELGITLTATPLGMVVLDVESTHTVMIPQHARRVLYELTGACTRAQTVVDAIAEEVS